MLWLETRTHDIGVCPVVRFQNTMELDDEVRGYLPCEARRAERPLARRDTVNVAEAVRIHEEGRSPVYDARFDSDRRDLDLPGSASRSGQNESSPAE